MNDRTNLYIAGVVVAGLACVAVMSVYAPGQLPALLLTIGGVVALLQKMKEAAAKVDQVAETVVATQDNLTEVHTIVNSQRTEMSAKIDALQKALAEVKQSRAAERTAVAVVADPATQEAVATARVAEAAAKLQPPIVGREVKP